MHTLIVVNSHKGNTRRIAEAIAGRLKDRSTIEIVPAECAPSAIKPGTDLVFVGCPTEGHGMTPEMRAFLDCLAPDSVRGVPMAAFDTRIGWPRLLSGSAADGIHDKLAKLDARVLDPAGSFIVSTVPDLEPGEIERAAEWADTIARQAEPVAV